MAEAVLSRAHEQDLIVMAAAVADFRPSRPGELAKIRKADGIPEIALEPTLDILAELGRRRRPGQVLVGFAAETESVVERAAEKLAPKASTSSSGNDVAADGVGFSHDTNAVSIVSADGSHGDPLSIQACRRRRRPRRRPRPPDGGPPAFQQSTDPGAKRVSQYHFTSESVTEGHPDKMADQISDAVLDAILAEDPTGRVACETLLTTGLVVVAGEITTTAYVDVARIVRETVLGIGYDRDELCFDGNACGVLVSIDEQSPDISQGVSTRPRAAIGHRRRGRPQLAGRR